MTRFEELVARKRQQYGDKFDSSDLSPQFIQYFNSGARIEVEFPYGEVKRGRIGITTGWKPIFLLMLTRRSIGSSYTLHGAERIIRQVAA